MPKKIPFRNLWPFVQDNWNPFCGGVGRKGSVFKLETRQIGDVIAESLFPVSCHHRRHRSTCLPNRDCDQHREWNKLCILTNSLVLGELVAYIGITTPHQFIFTPYYNTLQNLLETQRISCPSRKRYRQTHSADDKLLLKTILTYCIRCWPWE